ncbi:DNA cytosine methyltransferase [Pseudacidovorax intermedius]|uniref:DNA (cytosine-5-)-methyltransferase n=1 Tax=Pseudacidovorax intermedius TaxID=433924 RepID=A0A147GLC7_9BURK|nr:DNA cytosine methyltransferase [Pseudacidovorax intermedius]KTT11520.1 DNA methyltransferase [Pseudacidovorax intermedius]
MKRDDFTLQLDLGRELIIDNFAGGGGTSEGLEAAFGRPVDIAINHDPEALAMHAINHPHTHHLCESVWDVNPIEVTRNQPVGLVWLSPDCKHFSKAKGGTPVSKHIRGLAWVGMRWIATTKPRVLMLENVEEFQTWGPLIVGADGTARPDPARRGKTFESFVRQLRGHGYAVDWREIRACDQGAPTIRKRLFLVARRDGLPIIWPEKTHAEPTDRRVLAGELAAYRTAAECIDFQLQGVSIFGRARPLATNTQRRVAKGLWRHVLTSASPFIVGAGGPTYAGKPQSMGAPLGTLTADNHRAVVAPTLAPFITEHANASNQRTMAANEPLRTQCAQVKGGHFSVVAPVMAPLRGTEESHLQGDDVRQPLSTVSAGGTHHAMAAMHITKFRMGSSGACMDEPMPTVTANSFIKRPGGCAPLGMVAAHLVDMGHGEGKVPGRRFSHGIRSMEVPLNTVTASGATSAIVAACMEQANGGFYAGEGRSADAPMSTITAAGSNQQLVMAYLVKYYSSGGQDAPAGSPMHTLPTKGRMGLVEVQQVPAAALAPEHRARARQCAALLHEHLPEQFPEVADMVLMSHEGTWWVLVDITLRMLKPRELFNAQGFPARYVIDEIPDPKRLFADGVQAADPLAVPRIPLSATAQVRMCGNSVSPPVAEALVRANFAHEALIYKVAA